MPPPLLLPVEESSHVHLETPGSEPGHSGDTSLLVQELEQELELVEVAEDSGLLFGGCCPPTQIPISGGEWNIALALILLCFFPPLLCLLVWCHVYL